MKAILMAFLLLNISPDAFLFAQVKNCTWLGTVDSVWENPTNWSCGQVPDANTDVFIAGGTPFNPVVTQPTTLRSYTALKLGTIEDAKAYLMNAYRALAGDQGYGSRLSLYYTVDNDETLGPEGPLDNSQRDIARYRTQAVNSELLAPFNQLYDGIKKADSSIKYIPLMPSYFNGSQMQKAQLKRMLGEALTLKAQFFFELIKNWGDVPIHYTSSTSDSPNTNVYNTPKDSTYNKILSDLSTAQELLPWRNETGLTGDTLDERITKGAAKALRARIALFRGGYPRSSDYLTWYQVARNECKDIMEHREQHTLNPNYKSIWKNTVCKLKPDDGYGEILFQVAMSGGSPLSDSKLGYHSGPKVNGIGNSTINILPTYFYRFHSKDTRRDVTCAPYNVSADAITKTGLALTLMNEGKFRRDWLPNVNPTDNRQHYGINLILIRFSDVLLMFAEAENELNGNPTPAAIRAYEEVRKRAFGSDSSSIGTTPTTKNQFFNSIVNERSFEFGSEGIRKYDLARWNLLATKLNETKTQLNALGSRQSPYNTLPTNMYLYTDATNDDSTIFANSYYSPAPSVPPSGTTEVSWISSNIITTMLGRFASGYYPSKERLPYSQSVMDANFGIIQNPGY